MVLLSREALTHHREIQKILPVILQTRLDCEKLVRKVGRHKDYHQKKNLSNMCGAASEILRQRLPAKMDPHILHSYVHALCGFRPNPRKRMRLIVDLTLSQFAVEDLVGVTVYIGTFREYLNVICWKNETLRHYDKAKNWSRAPALPKTWSESQHPPKNFR
jgi:hypothetical protein